MSEYNNNFENKDNMDQYGFQGGEFNQAPARKSKKQHSGRTGRAVKKLGAITLSAVLFGGVAAGTFQTVNHIAGYTSYTTPEADNTSAPVSLSDSQESQSALRIASAGAAQTARGNLDVSDIAESVMPSIVSITNKSVQEIKNYFSMFGYGGQSRLMETESAGSGFIIGKNGEELLIVTNCHVVENADMLTVCFVDNQAYEASIKGTDSANDLAVIAIPLSSISLDTMAQIKVASIGDSEALKVGEQVVAIGNALGYGQSVTTGIVSAKNRSIAGSGDDPLVKGEETPTYIQTDAAINPGNSGGALVNSEGAVIGINSAKYADEQVEGMGFAIPISTAVPIINDIIKEEAVPEEEQGYLGIRGNDVSSEYSEYYNVPLGVFVGEVSKNSPAEKAGMLTGDIITKFDGRDITTMEGLYGKLKTKKAGEKIKIVVERSNNGEYKEKTLTVTLGTKPQDNNN